MAELKRILNFPTMLLIVINSIMGTGIYFLPSIVAKYVGYMSLIPWIIMSLIAIYISMCFAELSSMFPKAGGVYEYSKQAYGRFTSFLIGWITLIAGNITIAMLIVGAIHYLLPYDLPIQKALISLVFILVFNYMTYRGIRISSIMLVTFSIITIAAMFSLTIPGLLKLQPANFKPFFVFPISSIFITLYFIQETFFGWESATFLAEETKEPERVMPKALIIGTICVVIISLLFVITVGNILQESSKSITLLSELGTLYFGEIGRNIFTLWTYLAIIGGVACWVVSTPRLLLALARDRLFLTQFSSLHHKYNTPHKAILFQIVVTSLLVITGLSAYQNLLLILLPFALIMYIAVLFALVTLRLKKPEIERPYKVPFGSIGAIIVIFIMVALLFTWAVMEEKAIKLVTIAISLIALGIPIYFLLELYYNPKAIRKTNNLLAYLVLLTERLALPIGVRMEIIKLLGNIRGKTVLEFGCSVGTLTMHLAEEVGKDGLIYATDISEKDIEIAKARLEKKGHRHVKVIHDLQHHQRVHPDVPTIHTVVSVGMIGYVKDVKRVLKHMNVRLRIGAKICFVDYDKFFDIIPNKEWLSNDKKIKRIFEEAGFKVEVIRKQGFAWRYIFIYGKKVRDVR